MSKKSKLLMVIAFLILSCITAWAMQNNLPEKQLPYKIGSKLNGSSNALISTTSSELNPNEINTDSTIATVMGEEITKKYFIYRMDLYEACGSQNPAQDAWNLIKMQSFEKNFAKEHNLLPSDKDIVNSTNQLRDLTNSTEESRHNAKALISAMGLSEDEYWNTFKPKYETLPLLIKENVSQYCIENNIPQLDLSQIEYEILNTNFFDELGITKY